RFAFAASEGVPPSEIDDLDIHHVRKCWGYRCCNPDHLEVLAPREHAREHAADLDRLEYAHMSREEKARRAGLVAQRHEDMVHTLLLDTPPRERRPAEFEKVTGAGSLQRCFAGLPFMIRRGEIGSVTAELLQPENE